MVASTGAGHRRRNLALLVVAAAVLSAAGGVVIGRQLQSPADAAAEADAPEPSRITVPVERRSLVSRLVANGDVQFTEPTPLRLAGSVGASAGSAQVVTKVPVQDAVLAEGDVALEVSGRPVFVFQGTLPTYRPLEPGTSGPDVQQLEQALVRLGVHPGPADTLYDTVTESALDRLYTAKGYESEGPSDDQRTRLRAAEKAVSDANSALTKAKQDLASAGKPLSGAELLRQQQTLQAAWDAVPGAQATAARRATDAEAAIVTATTTRDLARTARDTVKKLRDAAVVADAVDPDTAAPYTSVEIGALQTDLLAKEQALTEAESALRRAASDRDNAALEGAVALKQAQDALLLAQLSFDEAVAPKDSSLASDAVSAAEQQLGQAYTDLVQVQSDVGTKLPAGEVIFVPALPSTITSVSSEAGKAPVDAVATVSGTTTLIQARVSATDADLLQVPSAVDIELRDADIATTGQLIEIQKPESGDDQNNGGGSNNGNNGNNGGNGGGGGEASRLTIIVQPDDPTVLTDGVGYPARISITVSSTSGDVLAVPVAAISVGPDGESRVEVERDSGNTPSSVEFVKVKVGLAAQGYAEIAPLAGGTLEQGDRVVVGIDAGTGDPP